jgi:hypothetical protein
MKRLLMAALMVVVVTAIVGMLSAHELKDSFQYLHPVPGSKYVSKETSILIRTGESMLMYNIYSPNLAEIVGSQSGIHNYEVILSQDKNTLILKSYIPFTPGEIVTVTLDSHLKSEKAEDTGQSVYNFTISPKTGPLLTADDWDAIFADEYPSANVNRQYPAFHQPPRQRDVSLPSDFPPIDVVVNDNPAPGYVFIANHGLDYGTTPYLMILDDSGAPVFYQKQNKLINEFKVELGNLLVYCLFERGGTFDNVFYVMDQTYTVIDSLRMGHGYLTDQHSIDLIPGYHAILIAYDAQTVDMSDSIPGGDTAATVIGLIVQELDSLKNVIYEWRSWDHFSIFDATHVNFTGRRIDYVHGNAAVVDDTDGNILLSCRGMDEVTKIDRTTGAVIWRLGKNAVNNQFTIVGDTAGFSKQHDVNRISNGHITIFDNGNFHTPHFSRAVEYELDETGMVCTQIWEYRDSPDLYGAANGGVQRLPGGNTVIGWGRAGVTMSEVRSNGEKAFELNAGDPVQNTYKAFRFQWTGIAAVPYLIAEPTETGVHLIFNKFGDGSIVDHYIYMDTLPAPLTIIDSTANTFYDFAGLIPGYTYYFRVTALDYTHFESDYSNEEEITWWMPYAPGDANCDGNVIGSDVTFSINYFRAGPNQPPDSVWNPVRAEWHYASADANGDCDYLGSDVTYMINYLRAGSSPIYCPETPPFGE